ncbi:MAG TPA: hypothetical protein IAA50_06060, partial [Candidatus Alistipes pullistercoris]|nr:hypothetical protein [Candidatus Alistipes pullistercoris]
SGMIFVAKSPFYVVFGKKFVINTAGRFNRFRQSADYAFLFHLYPPLLSVQASQFIKKFCNLLSPETIRSFFSDFFPIRGRGSRYGNKPQVVTGMSSGLENPQFARKTGVGKMVVRC